MADDLQSRLRQALGPARDGGDPARARAGVVAGVRRRHRQRLEVAAGGLVVALALAVVLPTTLAHGGPAATTQEGAAALPGAVAPQPTEAGCRIGARGSASSCGLLAPAVSYGGSPPMKGATSSANAGSTALGSAGHPLVLQAGEEVTVELPATSTGLPAWQPLRSVSHASAEGDEVVALRATARRDQWRIVAEHEGSAIVESRRPGCSGAAACLTPTTVWTLYLEVTP